MGDLGRRVGEIGEYGEGANDNEAPEAEVGEAEVGDDFTPDADAEELQSQIDELPEE